MVSFHVLLLDTVGNNLVNADFSPYSRMFFTVKHIYLTLYIVYMCRIAPIYSVPLHLARSAVHCVHLLAVPAVRSACLPALALLFTSSGPIGSSRSPSRAVRSAHCPCGRVAVLAAPVLAPVRSRARVRACAWALSAYLPVACRAFYSPIMYILRRYDRLARRVSAPPQTFLRSFSSRRYLSRCRRWGWVARCVVAIRADLVALRCLDDLLTSRDIKKIFFKGLDSLRPPCYDVHVNRQDTHNRPDKRKQVHRYKQGKHDRPTSVCESPTDKRKRVTDGRAEASERTANSGSKSTEPLQVHRRSTHGRTSQRWRRTLDIVVYPDFPRDESGAGSTCQAEQKDNFRLCQVTVGKSPIGAGAGAGIASRFSLEEVCIRHPITHSNPAP